MKKIVFINIPMKERVEKTVYQGECQGQEENKAVCFPVNLILPGEIKKEDQVKIVLLVKKDPEENYKKNISLCVEEVLDSIGKINGNMEFKILDTDFSQEEEIHDELLLRIVEELEVGARIIGDITYGPKDLPIILFTALNFAEKFYGADIGNLVYGQADFKDGKPYNTKLCDMIPLYYLNSITNTVDCNSPEKAKEMLKPLLSI